jgi:triphosphatase
VISPIETERRSAYRGVQMLIRSAEPTGFVLALAGWAESDLWLRLDGGVRLATGRLSIVVPDLLGRLAGKAHKRGRRLGERSLAELHALRKTLKKLRYCTEYCEALYKPKRVKHYQALARDVLEVLGALNDTVGSEALLDNLDIKDPALTPGIGLLSRSSIAEREKAMKKLPKAWKAFRAETPFWS